MTQQARPKPRTRSAPAGKPDISFKSSNTPFFPTPQEYEESMIKTGHYIPDPEKLTVGKVIASVFGILAVCAALFFVVWHILSVEIPDSVYSAGNGDTFLTRLDVIYSGLLNDIENGKPAVIAADVGIYFGISLIGLLAGLCDILLCRIPPDDRITDRFGFDVKPLVRYLPAITCTVYGVFVFVARQLFDAPSFTLNSMNFSLTGEDYTWATWVTEGFYALLIVAMLFTFIEAFSNSGLFGMIIRIPLAAVSNGAVIMVVMAGSLCAILAALMFVMIKVVGLILRTAFPRLAAYSGY